MNRGRGPNQGKGTANHHKLGHGVSCTGSAATATLPVHAGENLGVIKRTKDGHDAEELMAPPP